MISKSAGYVKLVLKLTGDVVVCCRPFLLLLKTFLPVRQFHSRKFRIHPRVRQSLEHRMCFGSLGNCPLAEFFPDLLRPTDSERIQLPLDEEREEVIAGDVCRSREEDGIGDSEMRFEKVDD